MAVEGLPSRGEKKQCRFFVLKRNRHYVGRGWMHERLGVSATLSLPAAADELGYGSIFVRNLVITKTVFNRAATVIKLV